jgi:hypothetical protein
VTKVPSFCWDVQELIRRKVNGVAAKGVNSETVPGHTTSAGFGDMVPAEWREMIDKKNDHLEAKSAAEGLVDSSSQIQFEFVEDTQFSDEENLSPQPSPHDTQNSQEYSQLYPRKLKFDQISQQEHKKQKVRE